jgi:hypothetical protein
MASPINAYIRSSEVTTIDRSLYGDSNRGLPIAFGFTREEISMNEMLNYGGHLPPGAAALA